MSERDINPEKAVDDIARDVQRIRETNRLEAMWDPSILDPQIHLTDEELADFVKTFSGDEIGQRARRDIENGNTCEEYKKNGKSDAHCKNPAVASIDFAGVTFNGSLLVCADDLRHVYASVKSEDVKIEGLFPDITINGKHLPKFDK